MIDFTCEKCGREISVDDIFSGQTGECSKCKTTLVIPGKIKPMIQEKINAAINVAGDAASNAAKSFLAVWRWCPACEELVACRRHVASDAMNVGLTLVTKGAWIPVWAASQLAKNWPCPKCGAKTSRDRDPRDGRKV